MTSANKLKTVAVIGAQGVLGSDLAAYLSDEYIVTKIDKDNYLDCVGNEFDILINANGNSRRFWANQNPVEDFIASTESVYKTLFDFKYRKYIYISSSDVYVDHSSPQTTDEITNIDYKKLCPYGMHKFLSEILVRKYCKSYIILRSSMILGSNLKKGPLFDVINGQPIFVTLNSRIQMITANEIAKIVKNLINQKVVNEVYNIGGIATVNMQDCIAQYFSNKKIEVNNDAETQIYEMNVEKINRIIKLKNSSEYLDDYLNTIINK